MPKGMRKNARKAKFLSIENGLIMRLETRFTKEYVTGFNHGGFIDKKVNKGLVTNKFLRCNELENWQHVTLCEGTEELKENYVHCLT